MCLHWHGLCKEGLIYWPINLFKRLEHDISLKGFSILGPNFKGIKNDDRDFQGRHCTV